MKVSEKLYECAHELWNEAAEKNFLLEMASGKLSADRYRSYMIRDYLYLLDYIELIRGLLSQTVNDELKVFLKETLEETQNETQRVHVPGMQKLGIIPEEVESYRHEVYEKYDRRESGLSLLGGESFAVEMPGCSSKKLSTQGDDMSTKGDDKSTQGDVLKEYVEYMKSMATEGGLLCGLTALLQCSWAYAHIAEKMMRVRGEQIAQSPYKGWFEAYSCDDYVQANNKWINVVDKESEGIDTAQLMKLSELFRTCAEYENRFWDSL